ncbi:hypothetical protein [Fontivita pretiosa]|uniref:hypothetical protein n=1 Tax=Fontivita pretiosa TaxID=2989684 RepID=UPI003D17FB61
MSLDVGGQARADLLVAALDLKLVRLLRAAMRPAGEGGPASPLGPAPSTIQPRHRIHPAPRFEPRPVVHPAPRFEPRPVIHPQPIVAPPATAQPPEPQPPRRLECPIQPPWRVLAWETPLPPPPKIKLIIYRPDTISKGSLIDLFI